MTFPTITIELYGMPRARAGVRELVVSAGTVGDALAEVVANCPALADVVSADGRLASQYLLSLDGKHFVSNVLQPLQSGDRLLLLSSDAGG
ncbi:MAG: MoaD/ThiS family protein [Planctomycetes bacterium]|nr:MoaD/ThiS family protein [Planctomycetota bacterium]